jgi:hypothetical protein
MKVLCVLGISVAVLAGCGGKQMTIPAGYARAALPLPPEVSNAIPGDLRLADVLVKDGCYYYISAGTVFPVVTFEALAAGMPDQPYCLG